MKPLSKGEKVSLDLPSSVISASIYSHCFHTHHFFFTLIIPPWIQGKSWWWWRIWRWKRKNHELIEEGRRNSWGWIPNARDRLAKKREWYIFSNIPPFSSLVFALDITPGPKAFLCGSGMVTPGLNVALGCLLVAFYSFQNLTFYNFIRSPSGWHSLKWTDYSNKYLHKEVKFLRKIICQHLRKLYSVKQ